MISVYTDGACKRNPGHAGAGAVIAFETGRLETLYQYCGIRTNNYAELMGIKIALEWLIRNGMRDREILLHSDSSYSIGVVSKAWNPKENVHLIDEIRNLLVGFPQIKFKWVKGHAGNVYNELADALATLAIFEEIAKLAILNDSLTEIEEP